MKDIDRFVPAGAAKDQLLELIRTVQRTDDVETIEVLSDAEAMRALRRSHRQARAGRWVTHTDLFGE